MEGRRIANLSAEPQTIPPAPGSKAKAQMVACTFSPPRIRAPAKSRSRCPPGQHCVYSRQGGGQPEQTAETDHPAFSNNGRAMQVREVTSEEDLALGTRRPANEPEVLS